MYEVKRVERCSEKKGEIVGVLASFSVSAYFDFAEGPFLSCRDGDCLPFRSRSSYSIMRRKSTALDGLTFSLELVQSKLQI